MKAWIVFTLTVLVIVLALYGVALLGYTLAMYLT